MQRVRRILSELPRSMRVGLTLAAFGAAIDLGYHLLSDAPGMGDGSVALTGHLTTLAGMVITMLGLVAAAFKRRPLETQPTKGR
jgi:hypothetical protein